MLASKIFDHDGKLLNEPARNPAYESVSGMVCVGEEDSTLGKKRKNPII